MVSGSNAGFAGSPDTKLRDSLQILIRSIYSEPQYDGVGHGVPAQITFPEWKKATCKIQQCCCQSSAEWNSPDAPCWLDAVVLGETDPSCLFIALWHLYH